MIDRIASISRQLSTDGARSFYELLDKAQGKIGVVVSFVAVLELIKCQLIGVVANNIDSSVHTENKTDSNLPTRSDIFGKLTLEWLA